MATSEAAGAGHRGTLTQCAVCHAPIREWLDNEPEHEFNPVMVPCRHTYADVLLELLRARRKRA